MARIAIVGAGIAGLLAAHDLHRSGYEVTLYSDKSPEDFLERARPTGTAGRFHATLEYERQLDLNHWEHSAMPANGMFVTFCWELANQYLTLLGLLDNPFYAIDVRLQSAEWMRDLERRGATIEIESVSLARLDEIASENDLTLVAGGKDARHLFPRDESRCTYAVPQRNLAMVNLTGLPTHIPDAPHMRPVKFNAFAPFGEAFWVPWYSKDGEHSWSVIYEARVGGPLDRFHGVSNVEQAREVALEVMRETMPWDWEWLREGVPCDDNSWLTGSFTPSVQDVVGTLPSGRQVMALGDTAMALDPIGGQGANNGSKMAQTYAAAIVERGEGPFDAAWMRDTFTGFWDRHRHMDFWNNTLLEPAPPSGFEMIMATYGSDGRVDNDSPEQQLANFFVNIWDDPVVFAEEFHSQDAVNAKIEEIFGRSPSWPLLRAKTLIAREQMRQKAGFPPRHPGSGIPVAA